jgi:NhaA family Na+:H+ antiporter
LALLGSRVPVSLKIFLTALAVIDDLGAIVVIAIFYTAELSAMYLAAALCVFGLMVLMNRSLRVVTLLPYLIGGVIMWFLMLKSGVHATIAGVMLAFAIPYSSKQDDEESPSHKLEHFLHKPVAYLILPIFALANTGIVFDSSWSDNLSTTNSLGILAGLVIGKPLGIALVTFIVVMLGLCQLPQDMNWKHVLGAGLLAGIGFTMSIFITNLAYVGNSEMITASKIAILFASLTAGTLGFLWLRFFSKSHITEVAHP